MPPKFEPPPAPEKITLEQRLGILRTLVEEKAAVWREQSVLTNKLNEIQKELDALRKEIARDTLLLDRDLAYVLGMEYGLRPAEKKP